MSLIKVITGVTKYPDIRVQKNCAAILITKNDAFTTEKIISKIDESGDNDTPHIHNLEIAKIGEIAAQREGFLLKFKAGGKEHIVIPVGFDGGIMFSKERSLTMDLNDLASDKSYEVSVIGGNQISNLMYQYTKSSVQSGDTNKDVNLQGALRAFVKDSADLTQISVNLGSHTNDHPREELQFLANLQNDIVMATQSVTDTNTNSGDVIKFGYINLLPIPHALNAHTCTVITDGDSSIDIYMERLISI